MLAPSYSPGFRLLRGLDHFVQLLEVPEVADELDADLRLVGGSLSVGTFSCNAFSSSFRPTAGANYMV